jgi:nucleoside-diphosphate-sugar epimerase
VKLITGANGFLGRAVLTALEERDIPVRAAVRALVLNNHVAVGNIGPGTNWSSALQAVDTIVHTAARTHVMNESAMDPLSEFRKVNVEGALNLASQAAAVGVKRFIFISSIKVNGESTVPGKPFTEDDPPNPLDPYSISKWESELRLRQLAKESGMEVVIIRPPLVYGPGVKANFQKMIRWVHSGVPLPLGSIHNKRSLVALENLVSLIVNCIENPAAANQTFLVGDGEDLSTTELLQRMGNAMGKPARLIPFPSGLLILVATLLGKKYVVQRLCGSLQVDISKAREMLGWVPPVTVDEGLRMAAAEFINGLSTVSQDL